MLAQLFRNRRPESQSLWQQSGRAIVIPLTLLALTLGSAQGGSAAEPAPDETLTQEAEPNEAEPNEMEAVEPRPLSVAPLSQVVYPENRPEWVDAPPTMAGSIDPKGVDVWPVKSLLRPTADEAHESLQVQIQGATFAYVEQFLGSDRVRRMPAGTAMYPEIETLPAADRYAGTALLGGETVYEEAVRLRFDEAYRQRLAAAWQQGEVGRRLGLLGIAAGGGFVLMLSATGFIRWTSRRRSEPFRPAESLR